MQIEVKIKSIYGMQTIYPSCDRARAFADIAGTRTLTRAVINKIKALGYTVTVKQPQPETI